jgi:succinate dehydrogenase/fumarate reductase flavoprotein subunit
VIRMDEEIIKTDVLVVGGGGAGLRAAIEAGKNNTETILVSKGSAGRSGATEMAGADLTADGKSLRALGFFGEPKDSKETWFSDIVNQGFYLNNQKLLKTYIEKAPERIKELLDWGMEVGFSEERALFTSGTGITDALKKGAKELNVQMVEDVMITDLLTKEGKVVGAVGIDVKTGQFDVFQSKAIVLASGGWHKAYFPNAGSRELSGDGQAAAYRAGAELVNMEMVTFCCNVLYWPPCWRGSIFTYILHMRTKSKLTNSKGEKFLEKYDPRIVRFGTTTEWNKSFLSIASTLEGVDGKASPHGGIFLSNDAPWEVFEPQVLGFYPGWKFKGVDFSEMGKMLKEGTPAEVGPAAEYFEGGISVNESCETNLPGLYAAGECSLSPFGANRVSAATTEMLVFGEVAGKAATTYAKKVGGLETDKKQVEALREKALQPLKRKDGVKPVELRKRLQKMAHESLGPVRSAEKLEAFIIELERTRAKELPRLCTSLESKNYNLEWIEAHELDNITLMLETAAKAALMRTESRGVHYRSDHPYADHDNWLKEIVIRQENGKPQMKTRSVVATVMTPPKGRFPYMEALLKAMEAHSKVGGGH